MCTSDNFKIKVALKQVQEEKSRGKSNPHKNFSACIVTDVSDNSSSNKNNNNNNNKNNYH